MRKIHSLVLRLKHWQAFAVILVAMSLLGKAIYACGRGAFEWEMTFMNSPAPALALYVCLGLWFDTILALRNNIADRWFSVLSILGMCTAKVWLRTDQPMPDFLFVLPLFALGIAWLMWVVVPTARIINDDGRGSRLWSDVVLVGCYFPFGLWLLQPRLNRIRIDHPSSPRE